MKQCVKNHMPCGMFLISEAMLVKTATFSLVPDPFKTEEMCNNTVEVDPWQLDDVPDHFKTQAMCQKVVEVDPSSLQFVPDHLKAHEMCNKTFEEDPYSLIYFHDWFVRLRQVNLSYDDCYNDGDYDEVIGWHNGYQKHKAQKAQIKNNFLFLGIIQDGGIGVCQKT